MTPTRVFPGVGLVAPALNQSSFSELRSPVTKRGAKLVRFLREVSTAVDYGKTNQPIGRFSGLLMDRINHKLLRTTDQGTSVSARRGTELSLQVLMPPERPLP